MIKKGSWIPISEGNQENLEDGEEDDVTNGGYYIEFSYIIKTSVTSL